jgi:hypothetical protein
MPILRRWHSQPVREWKKPSLREVWTDYGVQAGKSGKKSKQYAE